MNGSGRGADAGYAAHKSLFKNTAAYFEASGGAMQARQQLDAYNAIITISLAWCGVARPFAMSHSIWPATRAGNARRPPLASAATAAFKWEIRIGHRSLGDENGV